MAGGQNSCQAAITTWLTILLYRDSQSIFMSLAGHFMSSEFRHNVCSLTGPFVITAVMGINHFKYSLTTTTFETTLQQSNYNTKVVKLTLTK